MSDVQAAGQSCEPEYRFQLQHLEGVDNQDICNFLLYMHREHNLFALMIGNVLRVLPDLSVWRFTISGDVVASVNEFEERESHNSYTTERGAGRVGARTINHANGTYDIVVSADGFIESDEELADFDALVEHGLKFGKHIALHESGHPLLHMKGEDADAYQELVGGNRSVHAWRKHLAAHVDDFRIELMARDIAPSPLSKEAHLADALRHTRAEFQASPAMWDNDPYGAIDRTLTAANDLVRVVAYLAAELPPVSDSVPLPRELPDGWANYLASSWPEWYLVFHKLKPADEPMTPDELAAVTLELCELTMRWLEEIGIDWEMTDDEGGQSLYWRRWTY